MAGTVVWRLLLSGAGFFGFLSSLTGDFSRDVRWFDLTYFSQIGSLLVGVTALAGALSPLWNDGAAEGARGFLRGASTTYAVLIMIVFATLLDGDYASNGSLFEHLVVPVMALVDWVAVGRNSTRLQAWWPLVWLVVPLAYLPVYVAACAERGRPLYGFLDPDDGNFPLWAAALLAGFLLIGYLVWGIGRMRRANTLNGPGIPGSAPWSPGSADSVDRFRHPASPPTP